MDIDFLRQKVISELTSYTNGKGHSEQPLWSKKYSLNSRVFSTDFSLWICQKLVSNNLDELAIFLDEIKSNKSNDSTKLSISIKFDWGAVLEEFTQAWANSEEKNALLSPDEEKLIILACYYKWIEDEQIPEGATIAGDEFFQKIRNRLPAKAQFISNDTILATINEPLSSEPEPEATPEPTFYQHRRAVENIIQLDLSRYFPAITSAQKLELQVLLILALAKRGFDEFALFTSDVWCFTTAMVAYGIAPIVIPEIIHKTAQIIRKMREHAPSWNKVPLPSAMLTFPKPPDNPHFVELQRRLRQVPLGSRWHFFGMFLSGEYKFKGFFQADGLAPLIYGIRSWGIDAKQSTLLLEKVGLLRQITDPGQLLEEKTKTQIGQLLDDAKVIYRKSWNKKQLIEITLRECPDQVQLLTHDLWRVELLPELEPVIELAANYMQQTEIFYRMWLGVELANMVTH